MARSRKPAASIAASRGAMPWCTRSMANSQMRIAFFADEADQRHQAHLKVDVVLRPSTQVSSSAPSTANGHRQHHGDRQRPLLELRREQQEHHDQTEDEGRGRGAARFLLLQAPVPAQA